MLLDSKDILQVDATIIAGVFIFLAIGSIGEHPSAFQVINEYIKNNTELSKQIEAKETEWLQLSTELITVQTEHFKVFVKIDSVKNTLKGQEQETALKGLQDDLVNIEQKEKEIESKTNQIKKDEESLKEQLAETNEKYKEDLKKSGSLFLKTPEDWVYLVGGPFGFSAIFVLLADSYERMKDTKFSSIWFVCGVISMGVGFIAIMVIFYVIFAG